MWNPLLLNILIIADWIGAEFISVTLTITTHLYERLPKLTLFNVTLSGLLNKISLIKQLVEEPPEMELFWQLPQKIPNKLDSTILSNIDTLIEFNEEYYCFKKEKETGFFNWILEEQKQIIIDIEIEIGRAHVWTLVTQWTRMPSSAWKKKKYKI